MTERLKSPYPWFGGKAKVMPVVWERLGAAIGNFVDPCFGSGASILTRPGGAQGVETVNDADGMVANFWRAVTYDAKGTAAHADWPVNEADLHARELWLLGQRESLTDRLAGNPDYFDAKIAGWWVWGISCYIGSGFCDGSGPWTSQAGVIRKRPHLGNAGMGIRRKRPHLGNAGRGIHRQLPHLGGAGRGIHDYFEKLKQRMRRVRVACGDWSRVVGPSVTYKMGKTAVFLDPPYSDAADREGDLYVVDCGAVATSVREWAIENGGNPLLRIALCGYYEEHAEHMPDNWTAWQWKAAGGYGSQGTGRGRKNAHRECIWFSPHCLGPEQPSLFLSSFDGA